jgi:VIT1/CCC1 family predicted Fe2+/Mn2+ transporter
MAHDIATSIGTGIVSGLLGATVWCVMFAVVLNVLSSSYVAVGVVFVLVGIVGAVNSYRGR